MKSSILIITIIMLALSLTAAPVLAATPTPAASTKPSASPKAATSSPKPTASPSPSPAATPDTGLTTQKLKERIERVVEEKRDQIKGVLDDLAEKRRGFVGEVQRVSAEAITIKTAKGPQIISLNDSLQLVKANKEISVDDIVVGEWAIVMGGIEDDDFVAERIVISAESLQPKPKVVTLGNVSAITRTEMKVSPRSGGDEKTFTLTRTTSYQDSEGNTIALKDITKDIQVLVIGTQTDTGIPAVVIKSLAPVSQ